ncbi:mechanosensitive ion channel family protein [uncultured Sneathiella sp.]|jgi:small-conductance mechanosensitive channel|uniref:mechanosensitive ion channel family protein n=1 Tax=uncultured Sneathiella sp. TaxID=879315 RepID=UPI0030DA544E|tara:strand:- start:5828 stop:6847 length:1020 start_codon:yes stop_codon:yes gene_type:complete
MNDSEPLATGVTLARETMASWTEAFYALIPNLVVGLLAMILFTLLAHAVKRLVAAYFRRMDRGDLGLILSSFSFWGVIVFGLLLSTTIVFPSVKPADMLASLGIGSLAIGFAFKDILQNWLAGLLILLRMPFRRGDQIRVGEAEGAVLRVEPRATIIRTYDGRDIVIPNTTIYTGTVIVNTSQKERRIEIDLTVGYVYDIGKMTAIIENSLKQVEEILTDPPPQILCWELGSTSLGMKVRWWINSERSAEVVTRSRAVRAIKEAFEANDIDPTDPQLIYYQSTDGTPVAEGSPSASTTAPETEEIVAGPPPPKLTISEDDPEAEKPEDASKAGTLLVDK